MAGSYSPQSGVGGVHIRQDLGNLSIGYHPQGFVADQVWPVFGVKHESDAYWSWDKGQAFNMLRSDGKGSLRADGTASKEVSFGATIKTYQTFEYALSTKITDRQRDNADSSLSLEMSKTRRLKDLLAIEYETRVASPVTTASNYASANKTSNNGSTQWNNASFTSVPTGGQSAIMTQLLNGIDAVRKATGGIKPNKILIPESVLLVMANDKGLAELYKYVRADGLATGSPFGPRIAGLDIITPMAMSENVTEGEAVSLVDIWGKNVVIFYSDPNPGLDSLTFGLTFRSRPDSVKQWREERLESMMYESSFVQIEQSISYDCAYLISTVIA
jgi:hypothetical protein